MKVSIFIDGNNFYHGLRATYGKEKSLKKFDFNKFLSHLTKDNIIVNIFYYNVELDKAHNSEKHKSQKEFFDNLLKIPKLNLILCKLLKRKLKNTKNYYYVLKEDDIHMAVDMVEQAYEDKFDIAILVSGDGDFVPAVKAVQRKNKIVENIYFKKSSSRNLKTHCNSSFELTKEILDKFFNN